MSGEALGFIQLEGLAAAYLVADAGLKAAGVRLVNLERIDGGSLMLIRFAGDVSSIQAAVEIGLNAAQAAGSRARGHVIARPSASTTGKVTTAGQEAVKKCMAEAPPDAEHQDEQLAENEVQPVVKETVRRRKG